MDGQLQQSADANSPTSKDGGIKSANKILLVLAVLVFAVLPVWIWLVAPQLTKLPADFSYEADVLSIDNFYDEAKNDFSGEARSVTKFSYEVLGEKDGVLTIKNVFDVRTVTGDPIFAVERLYGIDPKTGEHVAGYGDKDRVGYLFAPKGLKYGEPFTYWHINYDGPAHMQFAGEEVINGLKVYRYESRYEGVDIDQTQNLTFLPGVGVTRGINLDPYLQLWIEPVTGYLVKYKDATTAYYYDLQTKQRLHPWNQFGNTYERASVIENTQVAKTQKLITQTTAVTIPLLLFVAALTLLSLAFQKKRYALFAFLGGVVVLVGLFALWLMPAKGEASIEIGISRWVPLGNEAYDQNIQGFKDALTQAGYEEGKDVVYDLQVADADRDTQRAIAQSFKDRGVALIYSQTTPGTLILKEEITDIPIVFSIVTYPVEAGLINSLKNSGNNLVGTRNWVPIGDQMALFRAIVPRVSAIGFAHRAGEPNSTIQLGEMRQAALPLGIRVVEIAGGDLSELTQKLESVQGVDSIFSACDTLVQGEAEELIIAYAHRNKLPSFSCNSTGPFNGDLVGVVADFYQIGRLAGEKAVLILEGATPSSLSTDTVARPFVYVNQKTADFLGITIPQNILAEAKEVIK